MDLELIFSATSLLAMAGWLVLLASPWFPRVADVIAGIALPVILSLGYVIISIALPAENGGGFGSLAEVQRLFTSQSALLAGWIHFLAFDLFVGAWICRTARDAGIRFWLVLPCLPVTFLFGPAGFVMFQAIREGQTSARRMQT
ncbi:hypothetical protein ACMU_13960 [Actibacterium mucosum KCTC 23349]|uniref:DUF4281 domain-containing protein n=1 Tax=Actibacterium mucosum KCTC 23349 TaxID=1454373 RepID=A0A037ZGY2_9RHOB|nr:ABA4-like family protein [Actibacterium mucosum]KAJ54864.1 hypothetical protein ACMU_13960 [Actibacterium mucosum KCTC 23349]